MKRGRKRRPSFPFKPAAIKKLIVSAIFTVAFTLAAWVSDSGSVTRFPRENHPVEIYANQTNDNLTQTFASAIDDAKQSVTLLIYSLTDPTIIACLKKKSEEGVAVNVVCDAKASPKIDAKLGDGISLIRRFGPGLMHQKILIVDNEKTWIGSANMTSDSLKLHGNLVNAIHNKYFAEAAGKKASTLEEEGTAPAVPKQQFTIGQQTVELWFLPDNKRASIRIKELIRQAEKTVRIAMFTWTRQDLAHAVIDAAKRGVDTEVVIDRNSGKGSSAAIVKLLKDNGIKVSLSDGTALLHHKFLYVDGSTLVNGSANWTKAAFTQNDDCFIVVHDLTKQQNEQMEALWMSIIRESTFVH